MAQTESYWSFGEYYIFRGLKVQKLGRPPLDSLLGDEAYAKKVEDELVWTREKVGDAVSSNTE